MEPDQILRIFLSSAALSTGAYLGARMYKRASPPQQRKLGRMGLYIVAGVFTVSLATLATFTLSL